MSLPKLKKPENIKLSKDNLFSLLNIENSIINVKIDKKYFNGILKKNQNFKRKPSEIQNNLTTNNNNDNDSTNIINNPNLCKSEKHLIKALGL